MELKSSSSVLRIDTSAFENVPSGSAYAGVARSHSLSSPIKGSKFLQVELVDAKTEKPVGVIEALVDDDVIPQLHNGDAITVEFREIRVSPSGRRYASFTPFRRLPNA